MQYSLAMSLTHGSATPSATNLLHMSSPDPAGPEWPPTLASPCLKSHLPRNFAIIRMPTEGEIGSFIRFYLHLATTGISTRENSMWRFASWYLLVNLPTAGRVIIFWLDRVEGFQEVDLNNRRHRRQHTVDIPPPGFSDSSSYNPIVGPRVKVL